LDIRFSQNFKWFIFLVGEWLGIGDEFERSEGNYGVLAQWCDQAVFGACICVRPFFCVFGFNGIAFGYGFFVY